MAEKPHLSITQVSMLNVCPESWRRRYLEGERIAPGFAMVRGRSVHAGAEFNFRQKIQSHVDVPAGQIVDRAVAQVQAEVDKGGVSLAEDEIGKSVKALTGATIDTVAKLARLHATTQAPEYQPLLVEDAVRVILPQSTHDLKCVMDLVTTDGTIVDLKTSGKTATQQDADQSIQLTAYHFARQSQTGQTPSGLVLDVMVDKDTNLKRQRINTTRTQSDVDALGERFTAATQMIQAGIFQPAPVGSWQCSARWCCFHSTCRFVGNSAKRQGD